jgi:hypothetical protein
MYPLLEVCTPSVDLWDEMSERLTDRQKRQRTDKGCSTVDMRGLSDVRGDGGEELTDEVYTQRSSPSLHAKLTQKKRFA